MKKNIGFIPMDSVLEEWLLEKLMKEPPKSDCAEDLLSGIRDMLSGEVTSLLLSASGEAEAVNTNCPVCKTNMTECTGPEPEPQEPEETEPPQEEEAKSTGMGGLVVFLVVALIGGGAALYFFKFKKPKADTKGGDELDEYDFGEDEDDEDEPAPEDEEPAEEKPDCP